jgi:hypothetical protein
VLKDTAICSY